MEGEAFVVLTIFVCVGQGCSLVRLPLPLSQRLQSLRAHVAFGTLLMLTPVFGCQCVVGDRAKPWTFDHVLLVCNIVRSSLAILLIRTPFVTVT